MPGCHHLSDQGRYNELVKVMGPAPSHVKINFLSVVQTCDPDELVHSLLEVIKNIGPGEISETIVVALPHLQTGTTTPDGML